MDRSWEREWCRAGLCFLMIRMPAWRSDSDSEIDDDESKYNAEDGDVGERVKVLSEVIGGKDRIRFGECVADNGDGNEKEDTSECNGSARKRESIINLVMQVVLIMI